MSSKEQKFLRGLIHDLKAKHRHIKFFSNQLKSEDYQFVSERAQKSLGFILDTTESFSVLLDELSLHQKILSQVSFKASEQTTLGDCVVKAKLAFKEFSKLSLKTSFGIQEDKNFILPSKYFSFIFCEIFKTASITASSSGETELHVQFLLEGDMLSLSFDQETKLRAENMNSLFMPFAKYGSQCQTAGLNMYTSKCIADFFNCVLKAEIKNKKLSFCMQFEPQ